MKRTLTRIADSRKIKTAHPKARKPGFGYRHHSSASLPHRNAHVIAIKVSVLETLRKPAWCVRYSSSSRGDVDDEISDGSCPTSEHSPYGIWRVPRSMQWAKKKRHDESQTLDDRAEADRTDCRRLLRAELLKLVNGFRSLGTESQSLAIDNAVTTLFAKNEMAVAANV